MAAAQYEFDVVVVGSCNVDLIRFGAISSQILSLLYSFGIFLHIYLLKNNFLAYIF